tara:strand:+ start:1443 stop:2126 length:684 start_codon:yes stop_codon:yes gene_type:complete
MTNNRTNINNIYYDQQQQLQITTINDSDSKEHNQEQKVIPTRTSSSFGQKVVGGMSHQAILPWGLRSMKIDLFDNATNDDLLRDKRKFKISLGLITKSGKKKNFNASLNGPLRNYKRNVINQNSTHYKMVMEALEPLKGSVEGLRLSKFYESGAESNKQSIQDMSVIIHQLPKFEYAVKLFLKDKQFDITLKANQGLSNKQRLAGVIATWYKTSTQLKPKYMNDLLD